MDKAKIRRIWTWFTSQLDTRLVTNAAVGVVLGLLAFEVVKLLITLVVAIVGGLAFLLFKGF